MTELLFEKELYKEAYSDKNVEQSLDCLLNTGEITRYNRAIPEPILGIFFLPILCACAAGAAIAVFESLFKYFSMDIVWLIIFIILLHVAAAVTLLLRVLYNIHLTSILRLGIAFKWPHIKLYTHNTERRIEYMAEHFNKHWVIDK